MEEGDGVEEEDADEERLTSSRSLDGNNEVSPALCKKFRDRVVDEVR